MGEYDDLRRRMLHLVDRSIQGLEDTELLLEFYGDDTLEAKYKPQIEEHKVKWLSIRDMILRQCEIYDNHKPESDDASKDD